VSLKLSFGFFLRRRKLLRFWNAPLSLVHEAATPLEVLPGTPQSGLRHGPSGSIDEVFIQCQREPAPEAHRLLPAAGNA
jgi:hypothetical protein